MGEQVISLEVTDSDGLTGIAGGTTADEGEGWESLILRHDSTDPGTLASSGIALVNGGAGDSLLGANAHGVSDLSAAVAPRLTIGRSALTHGDSQAKWYRAVDQRAPDTLSAADLAAQLTGIVPVKDWSELRSAARSATRAGDVILLLGSFDVIEHFGSVLET